MIELVHDPEIHKLGARTAVHPPGMRMIEEVTHKLNLPTPPETVGWIRGAETVNGYCPPITNWGMMGNDKAGDCVFAGAGHADLLWSSLCGSPVIRTGAQVVAEYTRLTGYNPNDPNTDNGAVESEIWKEWQTNGLWGNKIEGVIGINPRSQIQIRDAVWFFGLSLLGLALPRSAQHQVVWDVPRGGLRGDGEPGSWGGHCTDAVWADPRGVLMVTWGQLKRATWEFMAAYCSEAYAALSRLWIERSGVSPGGVPLLSLQQDLMKIVHA